MNINIDPISNLPDKSYNYINKFGANPVVLVIIALLIIVYYVIFSTVPSSRPSMEGSTVASYGVLEIILWGVFIALLLLNSITYFYSLELNATIKNLFGKKPEIDIEVTGPPKEPEPVPEIMIKKQVYNIPNNKYTYEDAKALCKAYGGDLASYDQIEKSYNAGGEWCNYGWSKNQLALFPTQKKTYNKLQKIKGHENDCGRPGINGGFIANPNIRYGVNCFGYKPKITPQEKDNMAVNNKFPVSKDELEFDNRVKYWKSKLSQIEVSPFNKQTWSRV